jgi:low affinity Fe/Cu permease
MDDVSRVVKFIYVFLVVYICLIPFYYYPPISFGDYKIPLIKYVPLVLIATLFIISSIKQVFKITSVKKNELTLIILLYFSSTMFSGLGSAYYSISFSKAIYYAATGILIYFIVSSWNLNIGSKVYFLKLIVLIGFLASLYGIITLLVGNDFLFDYLQYSKNNLLEPSVWLKIGRISSSLGNPLFLGGVLSLLFPISVFLCLHSQKEKSHSDILFIVQSVIILLGLILTFSIGALVSVLFFCIYYNLIIKKSCKSLFNFNKVNLVIFLGTGLCCFILFILITNIFALVFHNNSIFSNFLGKIDFQKLTNIQGISLRWNSLTYTFDFLRTLNVFFGVGIGRIGMGDYYQSRVSLDNNLCLSLIESGIFATIALLMVFWLAIRTANRRNQDLIYTFLNASIIIFFINILFFDALNQPTLRILFWSFIGFLI